MRKFKIGERVETLDDVISGTVIRCDAQTVTILNEEGFELAYSPAELIPAGKPDAIRVSNFEAAGVKSEKEKSSQKKSGNQGRKEKYQPKLEVDLHIHQLVPSVRGLSTYDILNLQLETAKRQLEFAIRKRIQKVVFIHGVGEGVLKEELGYLFRKYGQLRYYEADYQKYGLGATEVYIMQNP